DKSQHRIMARVILIGRAKQLDHSAQKNRLLYIIQLEIIIGSLTSGFIKSIQRFIPICSFCLNKGLISNNQHIGIRHYLSQKRLYEIQVIGPLGTIHSRESMFFEIEF